MRYIDISLLQIPDDLKKKLAEATTMLLSLPTEAERKEFINKRARLWGNVKPYLTKLTGTREDDYKCWYCEVKDSRSDYHLDHFRPKNRVKNGNAPEEPGYWWLAFDHRNYRLCCAYCNSPHKGQDNVTRGKWDQFPLEAGSFRASDPAHNLDDERPLLLDPLRASDPMLLAFSEDGRVYPRYPKDLAELRAKTTIEILNLNDVRIEEARKKLWQDCVELVNDGRQVYLQYLGGSPAAKVRFEEICQRVKRHVSPYAEFSETARYCFKGTGEDWVLALL